MKAVILAGGFGTRISEETETKPKPMVEIGERPILWHIMKIYSHFGINDFIICLGYKGNSIKEYFDRYSLHTSDVTIDLAEGHTQVHAKRSEPWRVTLVDTGLKTMTGGRLKQIGPYLDDEPFCFTYGDGLADIDVAKLTAFHKNHGRAATVTAVQQPSRFGLLDLDGDKVTGFVEKPEDDGVRVNGGFFVLSPSVLELIDDDESIWERAPLETLARDDQLRAFNHDGFWQPMDTVRDKVYLEEMWNSGEPPWKLWS